MEKKVYEDEKKEDCHIETEQKMEVGTPVKYAENRGSYPEGTSPGLGKDYGK